MCVWKKKEREKNVLCQNRNHLHCDEHGLMAYTENEISFTGKLPQNVDKTIKNNVYPNVIVHIIYLLKT